MVKKFICSALILLMVSFFVIPVQADTNMAINAANILYELGLFQGTGVNSDGKPIFDLDRIPTRQEAVTMLIRLLGKDNEAKSTTWETPFTDVDEWAKPYVGYAYNHKLTSGIDATTFGGKNIVTASQYITFILRALDYNSGTDFAWDSAWTLSDSLGITDGEYSPSSRFTRADVAIISYNALKMNSKGTSKTLLSDLISKGVIPPSSGEIIELENAKNPKSSDANLLNAEGISAKCSPSVFLIEVFSKKSDCPNYPSSTGSGFFINPEGVAITCYHVLENSEMAIATTTNGSTYQITEILYADKNRDIAVIKVSNMALRGNDSSAFNYLQMEKSDTISSGMTCYAISSPMGLQNTISNGIISNAIREINGKDFIQTTVSISPGSSGGALINGYGNVIGVISSYIDGGQSLNLAIPLDSILSINLTKKGIAFYEYFGIKNNDSENVTTGTNCYFKTNVRTYTSITGNSCSGTAIMGEGAAKWYDSYIEGGHYTYDYTYEKKALDDLNSYFDYLTSIGFEVIEYGKKTDPVAKDYYIHGKYRNGNQTIKISYSNYSKRVDIDPPYKSYGGVTINNNITFYSNYPRVPDAGAYFNLNLFSTLKDGNSFLYIYDATGLPSGAPIVYLAALMESGFVYSYDNKYGDSVYKSGFLNVWSYFSDAGYFVVEISN